MLLFQGYTYCIRRRTGSGTAWRCSTHNSKGCNALIRLDSRNVVVNAITNHNHYPHRYVVRNGVYYSTQMM